MNHKKIILIIITLLLITGCGKFKGGGPSTTISASDIHKGSEGIKMEFINGAPPEEVNENVGFYVSVLLQNKGAFDIKDSYLLLGVEKDYTESEGESKNYDLDGKSIQNPVGEQKVIDFKITSKEIDKQSEQHKTSLFLTTCYEYQTEAIEEVCIDPDFYSIVPIEKSCEVKDISLTDQGAPVAVTKIEQKILQDIDKDVIKPSFTIYINNKGNGEVIDKDKITDVCSSVGVDYKTWNTIYVEAFLYDKQLDCKPKKEGEESKIGYLRLKSKEDFVKCTDEDGIEKDRATYKTPLKIKLSYGYTETISKEIIIKKEVNY